MSEAVLFAKELSFGFDRVLKFAMHIEKKNSSFIFIEDTNSLFDGRWNEENTKKFLRLLNEFYLATDYAGLYDSHTALFEESTRKFIGEVYGKIDFEWFEKYVDPSDLRCIYSLSGGNYETTVNEKTVYCLVTGNSAPVIHEYCHAFANPIADQWYAGNPGFKKLCDDSVNPEKMPFYNNGAAMAREYVTRGYNALYGIQHGMAPAEALAQEKNTMFEGSFQYIGNVYDMILKSEVVL